MGITRIAVIMAGGSGERFWPLSRAGRPKQLLRLTNPQRTMLEESIDRIAPLAGPDHIFVATSRALAGPIRQAVTGVAGSCVIGEPCKRNTAGALAYAAAQVLARFGEDQAAAVSMAVLTADHQIEGVESFRATAEAALAAAEADGALVTIGITPTRPETGYGYIEVNAECGMRNAECGMQNAECGMRNAECGMRNAECGMQNAECGMRNAEYNPLRPPEVYSVLRFREKPDQAAAREYAASGRFFWNSGMFFWRLDRFLAELELTSPPHAAAVRAMAAALRAGREDEVDAIFAALPDISIDYALMEKARNVKVVRAAFGWDDVGAWDALDRAWPHDPDGNVTAGDPVLIDAKNCIVYNEPGAEKMAVAVVGVEGLAVVVSPDGVLVVPKDRAQDVKKAVAELKKRGAGQL